MKSKTLKLIFISAFLLIVCTNCQQSKIDNKSASAITRSIAINSSVHLHLVTIIPEGENASFLMGTTEAESENQPSMDYDDYYIHDEQPAHDVTLTVPFEMGKYEITNEQFCRVMNYAIIEGKANIVNGDLMGTEKKLYLGIANLDTSAKYLGIQYGIQTDGELIKPILDCETHPVHGVTWYGAIAFCNFLSEMQDLSPVYDLITTGWDTAKNGFRLPTEAEWEYAARKDKRYIYSWGNEIDSSYLNFYQSQTGRYDTSTGRFDKSVFKPVGFYNGEFKEGVQTKDNSSPFGIYDMNGNVWEWCWDWYGSEYYIESPLNDPKGPSKGDDRPPYDIKRPTKVWRGCGWAGNNAFTRITKRWSTSPDISINEVGFRIARSLF